MEKEEKIVVPTFLKWAGGKQQLLEQFSKHFPEEIDHYVEPFLGGGAVLFYVLKYKKPKTAKAYDSNAELINVYLQVKNNFEKLIEELSVFEIGHNSSKDPKSYYYKRRRDFNSKIRSKIKKAALFIYLNKSCFNGLYRVNMKGEFNVPFNGNKKIKLFDKETLKIASNFLQNVDFETKDFKEVKIKNKNTVYFDPPYWSEPKNNGFVSYTDPKFNEEAQKELAEIYAKLADIGCKVILSNSDTDLINELYSSKQFRKFKIVARRMINCNGLGRDKINELLITSNY